MPFAPAARLGRWPLPAAPGLGRGPGLGSGSGPGPASGILRAAEGTRSGGQSGGQNGGPAEAARADEASRRAAAGLRTTAEAVAGGLPPLLAEARQLASTVMLGEHGRRRAGTGSEFWQYRPVHAGDEARLIDHRRSARSDQQFVRDREWQAAQSVMIWADAGQSMRFSSSDRLPTKARRAALLALAASVLLVRGGERVGLSSLGTPPRAGEVQLLRIAEGLTRGEDQPGPLADAGTAWPGSGQTGGPGPARTATGPAPEYGVPSLNGVPSQARALFLSDFLADPATLTGVLTAAADRGVRGTLLMVLDPQEEAFPFDGRTIFESIGGTLNFETQKARDLRGRYLERLATRKDELTRLAGRTGWQFSVHHTDQPALNALLWLHGAVGGRA